MCKHKVQLRLMVNVFSSAGFTVQDFQTKVNDDRESKFIKIIYWSWKQAGGDTTSLKAAAKSNDDKSRRRPR